MARRRSGAWVTTGVLTVMLVVACGDDDSVSTLAGSSVTSSTSASSGGEGGQGVCNTGPVMGSFDDVHGCTVDTATDMRCQSQVTVDGGYDGSAFVYDPKCLLVSAGTEVTITNALDGSNFQIHPLCGGTSGPQGGECDDPFGFVNSVDVEEMAFTMSDSGSYPYICVAHAGSGMVGVVYVE